MILRLNISKCGSQFWEEAYLSREPTMESDRCDFLDVSSDLLEVCLSLLTNKFQLARSYLPRYRIDLLHCQGQVELFVRLSKVRVWILCNARNLS